ncbi:hypothetical protein [Aliikangiella sp. IMCC44632]
MKIIKHLVWSLLFLSSTIFAEPMECTIGPITQSYGGNNWLVYACSDNESIVVVSAQGNPAMPFYFSISKKSGFYKVNGEGTGDKVATDAAYKELVNLNEEAIRKLILLAKNA